MSRERVYQLLREQAGTFVSGQELSGLLGISRAAVWKAIDSLRRDARNISAEARRNGKRKGYNFFGRFCRNRYWSVYAG